MEGRFRRSEFPKAAAAASPQNFTERFSGPSQTFWIWKAGDEAQKFVRYWALQGMLMLTGVQEPLLWTNFCDFGFASVVAKLLGFSLLE